MQLGWARGKSAAARADLGSCSLGNCNIWEVAAWENAFGNAFCYDNIIFVGNLSHIEKCTANRSLGGFHWEVQFFMTFFSWLFSVSGKKLWIKSRCQKLELFSQFFFDCDFFGCYHFIILWFFAGAGPCIILGVVFGWSGRMKKYYPKSLILKCICKFRGISKKICFLINWKIFNSTLQFMYFFWWKVGRRAY